MSDARSDASSRTRVIGVDANTGQGIMLLALKRGHTGSWKITAEAYLAK